MPFARRQWQFLLHASRPLIIYIQLEVQPAGEGLFSAETAVVLPLQLIAAAKLLGRA